MEIDAAHELVYRPGRAEPTGELKGRTRLIEILLLLACDGAKAVRTGMTEHDVARGAAGVLAPKLARRYLHELQALRLVGRTDCGGWTLALDDGELVTGVPTSIEHALALVQRTIAGDPRRRSPAPQAYERREAAVARAELALARGEPGDAIAALADLGTKEATFIQGVLRKLPKRVQDEFMTRAVGLRGVACMNRGETDEALRCLRYAQSRASVWKGGEEWLIRLTATEAAVHRMNAALDPDNVDHHIKACVTAFERGQQIVDGTTALPAALKSELRRWLYAEGTTALAMQAAREVEQDGAASRPIAKARRWLGKAFDELERLPADPAAEASTYLMQMRFAVLEGHVRDDRFIVSAERDVSTAASVAEHPLAPAWVRGWVPRYDADFAYFATRSGDDASVRESLLDAWNANRGFGFQQLLVLARFAAWSIDPADVLNEIASERVRDTVMAWHLTLCGRRMEECATCASTSDLLRRIRCVLKLDVQHASRDPLALGVWR